MKPEESARSGDTYLPRVDAPRVTRASLVQRRAVLIGIIVLDVAAIYGVILFAQWLVAVTR